MNVVDYLEYAEKAFGQVYFKHDPSIHSSKFGKPLAKEDLGGSQLRATLSRAINLSQSRTDFGCDWVNARIYGELAYFAVLC